MLHPGELYEQSLDDVFTIVWIMFNCFKIIIIILSSLFPSFFQPFQPLPCKPPGSLSNSWPFFFNCYYIYTNPWTFEQGSGKAHGDSAVDRELWATGEHWEREKQASLEKSSSTAAANSEWSAHIVSTGWWQHSWFGVRERWLEMGEIFSKFARLQREAGSQLCWLVCKNSPRHISHSNTGTDNW